MQCSKGDTLVRFEKCMCFWICPLKEAQMPHWYAGAFGTYECMECFRYEKWRAVLMLMNLNNWTSQTARAEEKMPHTHFPQNISVLGCHGMHKQVAYRLV